MLLNLSCDKTKSDDFVQISTKSPFDFHAIVIHEDVLYATGGDIWNKSNLLTSSDGIQWTLDSLTNKSIFDLYSVDETLYGVGNDGYIFSGQPKLKLSRTKFWGLLRAYTSASEGSIAVGGKDFNKGWIYKVNTDLQVDTAHIFENEILDVHCGPSGKCIACGYGAILLSKDSGFNWDRSSENGDYYNSISTNSDGDFFIVGYNGTIIKSIDQGKSWDKLKNGHSPLANNKPFRTIKFKANIGVIIGDNGLIWLSENHGKDWKDISLETDLDLFDFEFFQTKIVIVSESGQIFNLNI